MPEKSIVNREIYPQSHLVAESVTRYKPDVLVCIKAGEGWDTIVARRDLSDGTIQLEGIRIKPFQQNSI